MQETNVILSEAKDLSKKILHQPDGFLRMTWNLFVILSEAKDLSKKILHQPDGFLIMTESICHPEQSEGSFI